MYQPRDFIASKSPPRRRNRANSVAHLALFAAVMKSTRGSRGVTFGDGGTGSASTDFDDGASRDAGDARASDDVDSSAPCTPIIGPPATRLSSNAAVTSERPNMPMVPHDWSVNEARA